MPTIKQSTALRSLWTVLAPYLKNKGVQTAGGALAGLGASELENRTLLPDSDSGTKGINRIMGAVSGGMLPHGPAAALGSLTFKQLGLGALNSYQKDAPMRARISDTNLSAAQAAERTSKTNLETAGIAREQAGKWSPEAKALAGLAGAGILGAGIYGANSLLHGSRAKKEKQVSVEKGDAAARKRQKVRFDVPAESLPPEFFRSLAHVDDADNMPKRACLATRAELTQEIAADLATL